MLCLLIFSKFVPKATKMKFTFCSCYYAAIVLFAAYCCYYSATTVLFAETSTDATTEKIVIKTELTPSAFASKAISFLSSPAAARRSLEKEDICNRKDLDDCKITTTAKCMILNGQCVFACEALDSRTRCNSNKICSVIFTGKNRNNLTQTCQRNNSLQEDSPHFCGSRAPDQCQTNDLCKLKKTDPNNCSALQDEVSCLNASSSSSGGCVWKQKKSKCKATSFEFQCLAKDPSNCVKKQKKETCEQRDDCKWNNKKFECKPMN